MGKARKAIQSTHLKHKRAVKEGRDEKGGRSRRGGRQKARRRPILKVLKRTDRCTFQPRNSAPRRGAWVFRMADLKHNLGPKMTMDCHREMQSTRTVFRNRDNREKMARFRQNCIHVTNMNLGFQSTPCSRGTLSVSTAHPHFTAHQMAAICPRFPSEDLKYRAWAATGCHRDL